MSLIEMVADGILYDIEEEVKKSLKDRDVQIILEELISGLHLAGERFKKGEYFVVDMLQSAETFKEAMSIITPKLEGKKESYIGKVVIGTVKGDIHDIGKNLVSIMLEGAKFEVIDLGVDISSEKFVQAIKDHQPQVLGLSALLTTTMLEMENVIKTIEKANLRSKIKIVVGGAPVSERFAKSIGADAYSNSASGAIDIIKSLIS